MPNPVKPPAQPQILAAAPRCGARTRSGDPCRSPAVKGNARCRMHGGKGSGAARGNRNAWKHGWYSARVRAIVRYVRAASPAAFARRVEAVACEDGADGPRTTSAPAAQNIKNTKFEQQPHAPRIVANRSQQIDASSPGIRPAAPPPMRACRHLAQGGPKMLRFENRRAAYSNIREHPKRRNASFAGRPGPSGGRPALGKENLARPQTSLICAKRRPTPCGAYGIPA